MKKTIIYSISATILLIIMPLSTVLGQKRSTIIKYGIRGGMDFTSISYTKPGTISETMNNFTGFNAGFSLQILPPVKGLAIQPELLFVSKGTSFSGDYSAKLHMNYIELPVNIQYGIDFIFFRPFISLTPYIGYAVSKDWRDAFGNKSDIVLQSDGINRFEYGIGVGGGFDVWKLQLMVRYNWNLGRMFNIETTGVISSDWKQFIESINKSNFKGLEISLAFFF